MKNYYTILQIPENSGREEIIRAYRQLAKKYHPDVNKAPDAHEKFCEITEAYDFLLNHWPQHAANYPGSYNYEQKYDDYSKSDDYERFRREAKERAQHQARMRYEKFRKQHEAFQQSGINDLGLIFTSFIRFLSLPVFLFLFTAPVILAIQENWASIFLILLMWPFAIGIAWYYRDNRENYFFPGKLYYSPDRIRHMFTDRHPASQNCYYCPGHPADSVPYKMELLKLKDIKLKTGGFRQHNVNYINQDIAVIIPRSQKAFIIHSVIALIKVLSVIGFMIFLNISSFTWRMIAGIIAGATAGYLILVISRTKSNVSYLVSYGLLFRVFLWLICIALATRFYVSPFDIQTTDSIHFVITAIVIFDSFLMQLASLILGKYATKPITAQYSESASRFGEGYSAYNDIPVLSFIYPLYKWIMG
ncbi:MAG: DnaJ domain-containing protein [Bacteroidales bacterium]|nr:DnaJ domain-containing protein [Bacteroidales bacterium]